MMNGEGKDPCAAISTFSPLSYEEARQAIDALQLGGFQLSLRPPAYSLGSKTVWFEGKAYLV